MEGNMRSLSIIAVMLLVTSCSHYAEKSRSHLLIDSQADALEAKILLTELRTGHLTNALELLEEKLDSSIILIADQSKLTDSEVLDTLRAIKEYREKYPRKNEAVIPDMPSTLEISEKATGILAEVK